MLADHARRTDDIDPDIVRRTRDEAGIRPAKGRVTRVMRPAALTAITRSTGCNLLLKQTMKD